MQIQTFTCNSQVQGCWDDVLMAKHVSWILELGKERCHRYNSHESLTACAGRSECAPDMVGEGHGVQGLVLSHKCRENGQS